MQGADLLIPLAEIAGVFVGFGALIAARSGATLAVSEVNSIRWVVTTGIWVVIVALAPMIINSYGVTGHQLWLVCSLLALAVLVVMIIVFARTPENRAQLADSLATTPRVEIALVMGPTFWLPLVLLVVALALVVLDLLPRQEQALYLTAVALGLLMGALGLFVGVFWQRRPASSERGRAGGTGGAST
jgi:glucan phosphoethanolaminetransferase (alkaline phosphatase superfamily)